MKGNNGYPLSRDYTRLKECLDKGMMVVCFVNYKIEIGIVKEVCCAFYDERKDPDFSRYTFKAGGKEYTAWNPTMVGLQKGYPKTFEEMMALYDVEFIDLK